jgi:hypothetical protein
LGARFLRPDRRDEPTRYGQLGWIRQRIESILDTLVIALYVTIDDLFGPRLGPGRKPKISDAELVCLAVAQVLLGFGSERRWLRFAGHGALLLRPDRADEPRRHGSLGRVRVAQRLWPWPPGSGGTGRSALADLRASHLKATTSMASDGRGIRVVAAPVRRWPHPPCNRQLVCDMFISGGCGAEGGHMG